MQTLTRQDLFSLEQYAAQRESFRAHVLTHKRLRNIGLGPNMMFLFEDRLTVQYQVQEMLRIERVFEAEGINDELSAYNPLIPDGKNLKATMLVEIPDPEKRKLELEKLVGIEHAICFEIDGHGQALTYADEDMDRSSPSKTSAVHFFRFEFTEGQIAALKNGRTWRLRCTDLRYPYSTEIEGERNIALLADFD